MPLDPCALASRPSDMTPMAAALSGEPSRRGELRLWIEYTFGRPVGRADACSRSAVLERFTPANYNIRELVLAIVGSDSFRHVSVEGAR